MTQALPSSREGPCPATRLAPEEAWKRAAAASHIDGNTGVFISNDLIASIDVR